MRTYEDPVLQALEDRAEIYRADPEIWAETVAVLRRMSERRISPNEMGYNDPNGGCDECCDIAPFPDAPPKDGDQYICPGCSTIWTARDVSPSGMDQ